MAEQPEQSGTSCGSPCRLVYLIADGQFEAAKAEFEKILMGPDLLPFAAAFIAELGAGETEPAAIFGDALPRILQHGFCPEEFEALRLALNNPGCLDKLQFLLYSEGGRYWTEKIVRDPMTNEAVETQWKRLQALIASDTDSTITTE